MYKYNKEKAKVYYLKNKEHELARSKEYRRLHPEKSRLAARKYRAKNIEKVKERERIYKSTHKQKTKRYNKEFHRKHYLKCRERVLREKNEKYKKLRNRCVRFLGGHCMDCTYVPSDKWDASCLDFHHIDPKDKKSTVSRLIALISGIKNPSREIKLKLLEELKKCVLLCANCHRMREKLKRT